MIVKRQRSPVEVATFAVNSWRNATFERFSPFDNIELMKSFDADESDEIKLAVVTSFSNICVTIMSTTSVNCE